jgi:type III secretion protein R
MANHEVSLIVLLSLATLLPFVVAAGTCFVKFSVVLVLVRNAIGVQQVPSNMVLNSIALILSIFVMMPVVDRAYGYLQNERVEMTDAASVNAFIDDGLGGYKRYLRKYADPELVKFFESAQSARLKDGQAPRAGDVSVSRVGIDNSLFALLPAYALTEIKEAFKIGFYLYLPFLVVDLVVSSVLLALGMMMVSPVAMAVPIKLILFVAIDGWTMISKGLVQQYLDLMK